MDFSTILFWASAAVLGITLYTFYEENKRPKLEEEIPLLRRTMIVLTKRGLIVPKKRVELGPGKFHVYYDHPSGYNAVYNQGDLIPVDEHQTSMGTGTPVWMERDVMLEVAYKNNAALKKMAGQVIDTMLERVKDPSISDSEIKAMEQDLKGLETTILQEPVVVAQLKEALRQANNEKLMYQSGLTKLESGREGRQLRSLQPILELAGKRASRKDGRDQDSP